MGLMNVEQFQFELNRFIETEVPQEYMRRQIDITMFMFSRLIHYTPRRTGLAQGNWRVTANRVQGNVLQRYTPESTERIRNNLSGIGQGTKSKQGVADTIWVYNNVPYVKYLEAGNSIDPAKGRMVERAIAETRDFIIAKGYGYGGGGNRALTMRSFEKTLGVF